MEYLFAVYSVFSFSHSEVDILLQTQCLSLNFDANFNQGKSNQIRKKSGNLIC